MRSADVQDVPASSASRNVPRKMACHERLDAHGHGVGALRGTSLVLRMLLAILYKPAHQADGSDCQKWMHTHMVILMTRRAKHVEQLQLKF